MAVPMSSMLTPRSAARAVGVDAHLGHAELVVRVEIGDEAGLLQPVVEAGPDGTDRLAVGHVMTMTMSSDHRVIDGAMAAQYLSTVKEMLEKPATLLV